MHDREAQSRGNRDGSNRSERGYGDAKDHEQADHQKRLESGKDEGPQKREQRHPPHGTSRIEEPLAKRRPHKEDPECSEPQAEGRNKRERGHRSAIGFVFTRGRKRHSLRAHLCEMRTFTFGVARHLIGTVPKSSREFAAAVREAASAVGKLSCSLGKTMRTF